MLVPCAIGIWHVPFRRLSHRIARWPPESSSQWTPHVHASERARRRIEAPRYSKRPSPFGSFAVWLVRRLARSPFGSFAVWFPRRLVSSPFGLLALRLFAFCPFSTCCPLPT